MLAGTSTGAILALGLAKGVAPQDLVQLYVERGPIIFHTDLMQKLGDGWGLIAAKYSTENRYAGIEPTFNNTKLSDFAQKVLVAAFELDNSQDSVSSGPRTWKAKFFHNFDGPDSDGDQLAIDVVMRSSAAPSYFPIYQNYVDGGVLANNPSMCAVAQAMNVAMGNQAAADIVLCSIGTGLKPEFESSHNGNWGLVQWGFKLIHLIFDGSTGLVDYQCQQLLGERYIRLNVQLNEALDLDAVDKVQEMIALADSFDLTGMVNWIQAQWG